MSAPLLKRREVVLGLGAGTVIAACGSAPVRHPTTSSAIAGIAIAGAAISGKTR